MNNIIINKEELPCTMNKDVIRFLEVKKGSISFSLYKAWMHHTSDEVNRIARGKKKPLPIYFILLNDDPFPMIISEEVARGILAHPEEGLEYVHNLWHWRYP